MNTLQVFSYQNNPVSFKDEKGQAYINATEMAKPFGKLVADWTRLKSTEEFVKTLARVKYGNSHITSENLIMIVKGNFKDNRTQGTWMHEDVALEFSRWLSPEFAIWCNDRVKELMRYGVTASDNMINQMLDDPDTMITLLTKLKEERAANKLKSEKIKEQQKVIEVQAPKVAFAQAVSGSNTSCLVGEMATILKQNGLNFGQNRLFAWLRSNGFLCSIGERYNLPTQKSMDLALFEIKKTSIIKPDGTVLVTNTPKITGKGQIYFLNKISEFYSNSN